MNYYILTLGCQMNISDSQRIATKLDEIGYKSAPEKEADLVVINACSIRQHAVDRVWGKIRNWKKANKKIIITGCVVEGDKNKLLAKDIIYLNIENLNNIGDIIHRNSTKTKIDYDYFNIKPHLSGKIAYIPIMTGCDNFCSYCVVPYTRGREKSRPMNDIIAEIKRAVKAGYCEILLLGQNVNSYRNSPKLKVHKVYKEKPKTDNSEFIILLETIDNLPGEFTFNFMSSNPHDMGSGLIDCFSNLKKWKRELHLAMQSGDNEILKKMNRKYTSDEFIELVNKLKFKIKDLKLSTDIIVGFPGETRKQFENTVKICKKIGFTKAYISQYSPRPGTMSEKMKDDVSPKEKKRRWIVLDEQINR